MPYNNYARTTITGKVHYSRQGTQGAPKKADDLKEDCTIIIHMTKADYQWFLKAKGSMTNSAFGRSPRKIKGVVMVEIWCNGKIHYTRPSMEDKDVQECLALIKWHKLLTGGISSYEVREILPNTACTRRWGVCAFTSIVHA